MHIKRRYKEILPDGSNQETVAQFFDAFEDKKIVVMLGGPGMGKTTEFKHLSQQHDSSDYRVVTVSQFLNFPENGFANRILYLDALDEYRAGSSSASDVMDQIIGKLLSLNPSKVRLSCREMEWYSSSDLQDLSAASQGEGVTVIQMLPLDEKEIAEYVQQKLNDEDLFNAFMVGAKKHNLLSILGTPESLNRYLGVFKKTGQWPSTRLDLMEQSTNLLIEELNVKHQRIKSELLSKQDLKEVAEDLSAILTLGDKEGIALTNAAAGPFDIVLEDLPLPNINAASQVARRRIFASKAPEQIQAQHKTTGDFLCAKALVRRVRNKQLTFTRVQSLICGPDGGPYSHLRDVYAWIIALLPDNAERMMQADPYAALVYGDVGSWHPEYKRKALKLLRHYAAQKDPWFRAGGWYAPLLGGLACAELIPDFCEILEKEENRQVVTVVLEALRYGDPLPEMAESLWRFIYEARFPHWSDSALEVYQQLCPDGLGDQKILLDDVMAGHVVDEGDSLRKQILAVLYPEFIGPKDVVPYLICHKKDHITRVDWFLEYKLVQLTPTELLKDLVISLIEQHGVLERMDSSDRGIFKSGLITRLLTEFGLNATAEEIYNWQGLCCLKSFEENFPKEVRQKVSDFYQSNPKRYQEVFCHWLKITEPHEKLGYEWCLHEFHDRMLRLKPPSSFPRYLLTLIAENQDFEIRSFLFRQALGCIIGNSKETFDLTFEELHEFMLKVPERKAAWEQEIYRQFLLGLKEYKFQYVMPTKKRQLSQENDVNILSSRLSELRSGQDVKNLALWANRWFERGEGQENGYLNIVSRTNEEIADAMLAGFQALLTKETPYSVEEIVNTSCDGKRYSEVTPILAGANVLAKRSFDELATLPVLNLETLFAYELLYAVRAKSVIWFGDLIKRHPDVYGAVLSKVWRIEIAKGSNGYLSGSFVQNNDDLESQIIIRQMADYLGKSPVLPDEILKKFVVTLLKFGDHEKLKTLYPQALINGKIRKEQRVVWLAVATFFDPDQYLEKLEKAMRVRSRYSYIVFELLEAGSLNDVDSKQLLKQIKATIWLLGRYFGDVEEVGGTGRSSRRDVARAIRDLIIRLSNVPSQTAQEILQELVEDKGLWEWRDHLRHAQAVQLTKMRNAQFNTPKAEDISALLYQGAPINSSDFQVFTLDILDEIQASIRGDNANRWKNYWILKERGKLDKPKIENDCRDVFLQHMREFLSPYTITAEPEASAAAEKRVDIRLTVSSNLTLPIEFKCDDNDDLWTAMESQLQKQYMNDPKTGGYGVYLVFWFGNNGNGLKAPPVELGIDKPKTAKELESALRSIRPDPKIGVRVIDVTKPHAD